MKKEVPFTVIVGHGKLMQACKFLAFVRMGTLKLKEDKQISV